MKLINVIQYFSTVSWVKGNQSWKDATTANILHLFCIISPRTKLHITVLLIKREPESQEMKKVLPRKLSQEKLVRRGGRAFKSSPGKNAGNVIERKFAIFVGTIQRRFGRRTCRWRAGSMSPRLSVKLIKTLYFASSYISTFYFFQIFGLFDISVTACIQQKSYFVKNLKHLDNLDIFSVRNIKTWIWTNNS